MELIRFEIEYDTIIAIAEEDVSREASQAVSADGVSLYDGIRMVSRDEEKKKRLMAECLVMVRALCGRFIDFSYQFDNDETSFSFMLYVSSRRVNGKEDSLKTLFRSMTVNLFLNKFFASKNLSELASKYDAAALADVQALTKLLYEKLPPLYPSITIVS